MRIVDRLARLEKASAASAGMARVDLDAAAARFGTELHIDGAPPGQSVATALEKWRGLVEQTQQLWLRHVYAGMTPTDIYL